MGHQRAAFGRADAGKQAARPADPRALDGGGYGKLATSSGCPSEGVETRPFIIAIPALFTTVFVSKSWAGRASKRLRNQGDARKWLGESPSAGK
jgi:hypothetical protein